MQINAKLILVKIGPEDGIKNSNVLLSITVRIFANKRCIHIIFIMFNPANRHFRTLQVHCEHFQRNRDFKMSLKGYNV
jgi:hypothetical protein